jgi:predicted MFS family arabinose efflux permease
MQNTSQDRYSLGIAARIWTGNLILLAAANFMVSFGTGLVNGASTNFFVDTLGLSGAQVLWLAGIREVPGLILMFIAALIMHLPLSRRAAVSVLLMGVGYGLYALVHSYLALTAMALIASLGFHNWMPLGSSLAMGLAGRARSGRVMGVLSSVGALASIVGVGAIVLLSRLLPLRTFFTAGGLLMVMAAVLLAWLPRDIGETKKAQPRLLFRRRYWLYYVLTLFEGSRMQVFGTFGTLVLVQNYGLDARGISLLLLASSVANLLAAPLLGHLLDRVGERLTLSGSYVLLALCFVGYATVHNAWFLGAMLIGINLLVMLSMGLSTYVNRIAPSEELTPTLSTGVSVNHITSVSMSLLAGTLLKIVGYEKLCWGAAAIIMLSVPFALAIRAKAAAILQPSPAAGE